MWYPHYPTGIAQSWLLRGSNHQQPIAADNSSTSAFGEYSFKRQPPCWETQLKLGFEISGSWLSSSDQLLANMVLLIDQFRPAPSSTWFYSLTSSDQLPARHGFTRSPGQTSSKLDMILLVDQFRPAPSSTWFYSLTSSDQLPDRYGFTCWPVQTSSHLDMVLLVDQFQPAPSSTWFYSLTSSDQLPAWHGFTWWPVQTSSQLDMVSNTPAGFK